MLRGNPSQVAVVGAGVIGGSWAACFLARGLNVTVADPAPDAEARLRAAVLRYWPVLERIGLAPGAALTRLRFAETLEEAVENAEFVQESGPERLELKRALFRRIDASAGERAILATSSSGLLVSEIQTACARPERVVVGHPFNPPHLIPLVEVVAGERTADAAVERAMGFYAAIGKRPIHLRREIPGHVANRLQAALWREAFHLVSSGVASVSDVDRAIAHGPGLRWALLGPFLNLHLSGGDRGLAHALEHLGPTIESLWRDLGTPSLSPEVQAAATEGVNEELAGRSLESLVAQRDDLLVKLLDAKQGADELP
jgi:carnitine 3-dehydrogenase